MAEVRQDCENEQANVSEVSGSKSQIIDDHIMFPVQISLMIFARLCVSICGVVSNLFSTVIFFRLGLRDSMNVGLFCLSFTDSLGSILQVMSATCYLTDIVYSVSYIDLSAVARIIFGWTITGIYGVSFWITALVSVERCFCVVYPFKVKEVFTRYRCAAAVAIIYITYIIFLVPIYLSQKMDWAQLAVNPLKQNATVTYVYFLTIVGTDKTKTIEIIFDIVVGISMLILSQVIVVVCSFWMGYSLEKATRIRNTAQLNEHKVTYGTMVSSNLTKRERRLVKIVLHIAIILTVCNIPRFVTTTAYHTIPGMNVGYEKNLNLLLWSLTGTSATIGCSLNVFVYLSVNSKFRIVAFQCLGKQTE